MIPVLTNIPLEQIPPVIEPDEEMQALIQAAVELEVGEIGRLAESCS